jgi:hypothetical protein
MDDHMLFDAEEDWLFFRHGHGEYVRDALFQLGVPQIAIYRENEVLIHWNEFSPDIFRQTHLEESRISN